MGISVVALRLPARGVASYVPYCVQACGALLLTALARTPPRLSSRASSRAAAESPRSPRRPRPSRAPTRTCSPPSHHTIHDRCSCVGSLPSPPPGCNPHHRSPRGTRSAAYRRRPRCTSHGPSSSPGKRQPSSGSAGRTRPLGSLDRTGTCPRRSARWRSTRKGTSAATSRNPDHRSQGRTRSGSGFLRCCSSRTARGQSTRKDTWAQRSSSPAL